MYWLDRCTISIRIVYSVISKDKKTSYIEIFKNDIVNKTEISRVLITSCVVSNTDIYEDKDKAFIELNKLLEEYKEIINKEGKIGIT